MISHINVNGETYSLNHNLLENLPDSTTKFLPYVTSDDAECLLKVDSNGEWELTKAYDVTMRVSNEGDILVKRGEDSILFRLGSKLVDSPAYNDSSVSFDSESYYLTEIHMPSIKLLTDLGYIIYNRFGLRVDTECMYGIQILDIPNCTGVSTEFYDWLGYYYFTIIETVVVNSAFTHSNESKDFFLQFIRNNAQYGYEVERGEYIYSVKQGKSKIRVFFVGGVLGHCVCSDFISPIIRSCDGLSDYIPNLSDLFDVYVPDGYTDYFSSNLWCDGLFESVHTHPISSADNSTIIFAQNNGVPLIVPCSRTGYVTVPDTVDLEGYTFLGWSTTPKTMTPNVYTDKVYSPSNNCIVLYPVYAKLSISANPEKTTYYSGESLDYSGIEVTYSIGNSINGFVSSVIPMNNLSFSPSQGITIVFNRGENDGD